MVTTTLCISGTVINKAGAGMATTLNTLFRGTDFVIDTWIVQAEGVINSYTRKNWIDAYGSLNTDVKYVLEDTASNLAAIYAITYDMSGYSSRSEAEDLINTYRDAALRNMNMLKDEKVKDFVVGA